MPRKNHLSRLAAPRSWPIKRKQNKWITKPSKGPHAIQECVPLDLLIRDILGYAKTTREIKKILNADKVLIDNKVRRDNKFPIGIMDVISIPETGENFRLFLNKKGKFVAYPIKKEEANIKLLKIINKTIIKNNKIQLNFYDGRNMIVDKNTYKVNDSVVFDLTSNQIKEHVSFDKGALIYIIKGNRVGSIGVLEEVTKPKRNEKVRIIFRIGKDKFETLKDYAFIIGKDKPLIAVPEK